MAIFRVNKAKKLSLWAGVTAVAVLAGGLVGLSASAQADSPTCGAVKANVVGTYQGYVYNGTGLMTVEATLLNNNTLDGIFDGGVGLDGTWAISDSAVFLNVPGNRFLNGAVLVQGCAGAKLNAETLTGGMPGEPFQVGIHRNA